MHGIIGVGIIRTCFKVYLLMLLVRILAFDVRTSEYNSVIQFMVRVTEPLLAPLRRIAPLRYRIDVAAVILLLLLELGQWYFYVWLQTGHSLALSLALISSLGDALHLSIQLLFWAIVADSLLSWVASSQRNVYEVQTILTYLVSPILVPLRRIVPTIGQIDLSPVLALLLLNVIDAVIVYRIIEQGIAPAMGIR